MRGYRIGILLCALSTIAACGDPTAPGKPDGTWVLSTVNEQPLPQPISFVGVDYKILAIVDTLFLTPDGQMHESGLGYTWSSLNPIILVSLADTGSWSTNGDSVNIVGSNGGVDIYT